MASVTSDATAQATPRRRSVRPQVPSGPVLAAAVMTLVVAVLTLNIPYFALTPGPAPNVFDLIRIGGAKTKPVKGRLLLTTVSLHPIRVGEAIRSWLDTSYEVLPRSAIIPAGESEQDAQRQTAAQMDESQKHAATAALAYLGYDVKLTLGARVAQVAAGMPAGSVLKAGDVIVGADNRPVRRGIDLGVLIHKHKVGDTVTLTVVRGGRTITVTSSTAARKDAPHDPVIGVVLGDFEQSKLPLAVDIQSLGIGGPSAGLMYALGIVDLLDDTDLAGGRIVAGTGALSATGEVEQVGGVKQKVAAARASGATLFVAPLAELDDACGGAGKMQVIGVKRLNDAVDALRGKSLPRSRLCR